MIRTSRQLKALVRNMAKGDSTQSQIIIRNYVMERFLERISLSRYRNNFILKGWMLVSAMVGLDVRSTLDIDTTVKNIPLSIETAKEMIEEIISVLLDAKLETMRTPLKVDISTGDIITPGEVSYSFKMMFEERTISIFAYNLETVLAEKLETVISRGTANTRLRDYYDLYILQNEYLHIIDKEQFGRAVLATSKKRNTKLLMADGTLILQEIRESRSMRELWERYQRKFAYAEDISWEMVMEAISSLYKEISCF